MKHYTTIVLFTNGIVVKYRSLGACTYILTARTIYIGRLVCDCQMKSAKHSALSMTTSLFPCSTQITYNYYINTMLLQHQDNSALHSVVPSLSDRAELVDSGFCMGHNDLSYRSLNLTTHTIINN